MGISANAAVEAKLKKTAEEIKAMESSPWGILKDQYTALSAGDIFMHPKSGGKYRQWKTSGGENDRNAV